MCNESQNNGVLGGLKVKYIFNINIINVIIIDTILNNFGRRCNAKKWVIIWLNNIDKKSNRIVIIRFSPIAL